MAPAQFGTPISIRGIQGDVGPIGPQGIAGYNILAGKGAPAQSLGNQGDIYVDLDAGNLYAPKTASGWPTATRSLIGPIGQTGAVGASGQSLLNGYGPPDDSLGQNGDSYFDSQNGSIFGPKASGTWGSGATSLIGPPGGQGDTGTIIYSATGKPDNAQGRDGDFYIDTQVAALYGPKSQGDWGNAISLIGPKGAQGIQGIQGLAGANGATIIVGSGSPTGGKQGDIFIDAADSILYGPRGPDGPQAWPAQGYSYIGAQGPRGPQGVAGMVGSDGKTLLAGPTDPTDQGVDGDFYFQTTSGILYGPRSNGAYPTQGFLLKGPKGDVGPIGQTGAQGVQGPGILAGSGSPSKDLGTVGSFYIDGSGYRIFGPKTSDQYVPWGTPTAIIGPTGPQGAASTIAGPQGPMGAQGFSVQSGQGAPPSSLGNNGDLYVDLSVPALYGAKSNGAWPGNPITLTGPQGATGAQSTTPGPQGPQGYNLLTGAGAPSASVGNNGDSYIDINAANLYGAKSNNVWPSTYVSLLGATGAQGPQGVAGTPGSILRYGAGAPSNGTTANNGDFYIDQTNSRLYGPRASGSFGTGYVSLVGPIGQQGPQGVAGNVIASGSGAPASSVGNPGDYYIDSNAGRLYGPKGASTWPSSYITLSSAVPNDITGNSIVLAPVSGDSNPVQVQVKNASGQVFLADGSGNVTAAGTLAVSGTSTLQAANATTLSSSGLASLNAVTVTNNAQVNGAAIVAGYAQAGRFVASGPGSSGAPLLSYTSTTGNQTGIYSDSTFGSWYQLVNGYLAKSIRYISGPPADQGAGAITHLTYSGLSGAGNVCHRWYVSTSTIAVQIFGDASMAVASNLSVGGNSTVGGLTTTAGLALSSGNVKFADGTTLSTATVANQGTYSATSAGTAAAPAFAYTGASKGAGLFFDANGNALLSANGYKSFYSTAASGAAAGASGWAIASTLGAGNALLSLFGNGGTTATTSIDGAGAITSATLGLTGTLTGASATFSGAVSAASLSVQGNVSAASASISGTATAANLTLASNGKLTFGDGTTMTTAATGGSGGTGSQGTPGTQMRYGQGAPTTANPSTQNDGDSYIDTVQSMLYGPRANGTWPSTPTSLIGPTGPIGATGAAGPTFLTGQGMFAGQYLYSASLTMTSTGVGITAPAGSTPFVIFPISPSALLGFYAYASAACTLQLYDLTASAVVYSVALAKTTNTVLGPFTNSQYPMPANHSYQWQLVGSGTSSIQLEPYYLGPSNTPGIAVGQGPLCGYSTNQAFSTTALNVPIFGTTTLGVHFPVRTAGVYSAIGTYTPASGTPASATVQPKLIYQQFSGGTATGTIGFNFQPITANGQPQVLLPPQLTDTASIAAGFYFYWTLTGTGTGIVQIQLLPLV